MDTQRRDQSYTPIENPFNTSRNSSTADTQTQNSPSFGPTKPQEAYSLNQQHYGIPAKKSRLNALDLSAVLATMACFAAAVVVVRTDYATKLGYRDQIIALGFLLGIMNVCTHRIVPHVFLLLESRFGASTLHNYEGLLSWSPWVSRLHLLWRVLMIILIALPLGIGVAYKRYEEVDAIASRNESLASFSPVAPPGLQEGVETNAILANATTPFLSFAHDDTAFPHKFPQQHGFNLVLLSNESAASLDGPLPEQVTTLQQNLQPTDSMLLYAEIRGTVVRYNRTHESLRTQQDGYWEEYYKSIGWQRQNLFTGICFALLQKDVAGSDDAASWDCSYTMIGTSPCAVSNNDEDKMTDSYERTSLRFDARRHACQATWSITRQSIELVNATCDSEPLEAVHQYYGNSQLAITSRVANLLTWALYPMHTDRKDSPWVIPVHAAVLASAFQSSVVDRKGWVDIQPNGPIWQKLGLHNGERFTEIYQGKEILTKRVHIIRVDWSLYLILAIHPVLVLLAYVSTLFLYSTPVDRSFGLVSLLAGVDRDSLDLLKGAGFSGKLTKPVTLRIDVQPSDTMTSTNGAENDFEHPAEIVYRLGDRASDGKISSRVLYA